MLLLVEYCKSKKKGFNRKGWRETCCLSCKHVGHDNYLNHKKVLLFRLPFLILTPLYQLNYDLRWSWAHPGDPALAIQAPLLISICDLLEIFLNGRAGDWSSRAWFLSKISFEIESQLINWKAPKHILETQLEGFKTSFTCSARLGSFTLLPSLQYSSNKELSLQHIVISFSVWLVLVLCYVVGLEPTLALERSMVLAEGLFS